MTVPGTTPAPERTELRDLVAHSLFLAAPSTVEDAQGRFRSADVDFMAVLGGDRLAGVCARRDLAQILGSRYGYALYAHRPVTDFLMSAPLELTTGMPLTDVFKATADRAHREFYDDVVLLDGEGHYVGMIPMRMIVRLQTEILMASISALEASRLEIAGKNAQMELDLAMAREVQMAMLPRIGPGTAETGGPLGFAHRYRPAGSMSGDFFDVLELPGRSAGVLVCDVMGHGVRSALVTAMIRAMLEQLAPVAGNPGAFLTRLNRDLTHILRQTDGLIFVTAAYGVFDVEAGVFRYSQAGHPTPFRWSPSGGPARPVGCSPDAAGPALGLMDDFAYEETEEPLSPGDRWLLFTDGVTEAATAAGDEFGIDRLMDSFAKAGTRPLGEALDQVMETVAGFCGAPVLDDDACLLGVEFLGGPGR